MAPIPTVLSTVENNIDNDHCSDTDNLTLILEKHYRRHDNNNFPVSKRYLHSLLREYVKFLEKRNQNMSESCHHDDNETDDHDDILMQLIFESSLTKIDAFPDPNESCYQSFLISAGLCPNSGTTGNSKINNDVNTDQANHIGQTELKIRVFPKHNDVSLKLWEAGACLAEFFLAYPEVIQQKRLVELGAGVGLTSLIATQNAARVHMTDYTGLCLENMQHNIAINRDWSGCPITSGFLEWTAYAKNGADGSHKTATTEETLMLDGTFSLLDEADILIAADVVYDIEVVPALAGCVQKFLYNSKNKNKNNNNAKRHRTAIFATTFRNKSTFDLFHNRIEELGVECRFEPERKLLQLPRIFPCYHVQPRSDVRICFMRRDGTRTAL